MNIIMTKVNSLYIHVLPINEYYNDKGKLIIYSYILLINEYYNKLIESVYLHSFRLFSLLLNAVTLETKTTGIIKQFI